MFVLLGKDTFKTVPRRIQSPIKMFQNFHLKRFQKKKATFLRGKIAGRVLKKESLRFTFHGMLLHCWAFLNARFSA